MKSLSCDTNVPRDFVFWPRISVYIKLRSHSEHEEIKTETLSVTHWPNNHLRVRLSISEAK